ncbi:TRIO and F-actin-binding protein isoform X5 [Notamacropus eugenii]|uniref:TRIO and F-actin-binding protein isoform X5 n=1 Tax=Notamacropus eugenii TaxID=9315 RepID=UPI003B674085
MMEVTDNVPCKHFQARVFAKSHCQNCSEVQEAHCDSSTYLEPGRLVGTKTPYCDLQQGPHHPKDTLCILTPSCELVVATGSEQTPESLSVPVDCPSADSSAAQPGGQEIGGGVPYLESLTSPQLRNSSEFSQASRATASISPDRSPGTHCPDDTSTPDTEDLDAVNWTDKPWCSDGLIMMFARHQERAQADSPHRAPSSVSRPSATGDTLGPRREDPSHGNQSSRESRSKSRGERGYFSLEKNKLDSAQVSQSLQSGLRSISRNPEKTTYHDIPQASSLQQSTQQDTTRASSPHRSTQRDTTRSSSPHRSTQRDTTRSSSPHQSTQRDTTRSSSPHRSTQRDTTRSSSPHRSTQRDTTRSSSPHRSTQRDTTRSSSPHRSTQRDTTRSSSPHRSMQRDTTRFSSPHRSTQRDTTRSSSPHGSTQRDTTRSSSPHGSTQRDTTRSSSPHRSTQQDTTRSSSPHRSTQRDTTRCSSPHRSTQRDTTRSSSPHRSTQRDTAWTSSLHRSTQQDTTRSSSPHRSTQRDTAQTSSPHRSSTQRDTIQQSSTQRDNTRSSSTQRGNLQASSPAWSTPKENPRASSSQRDNLRVSSTQRDNPGTSSSAQSIQRDNLQASSSHRDNPRTCSTQRDNPRVSCPARTTPKDNPRSSSIQRDNPGSSSPTRSSQRSNPRTSSPHRTNRDIPWASFPLRPVQSDGPRASSPARPKQSEVPWASFPLRPVQGDSSRTSSPTRSSQLSLKTSQRDSPTRGSSCHSGPRSSTPPLSSTRTTSQASSLSRSTSLDSPNPPSVVCIGHRDAPRASSPPRFSQHDPFSFFPEPHDDESLSPHHEPPYIPPAVCIGHRDAPRASSPPRHSQHDPFPFLPNTSDTAESQSPQHDPPQMPPSVCIGHRDAPRASSPPRQSQQEPSLLYQEPLGASSESLAPSTSSVHDPPHVPPPVCIGHRDAPPFSSPPRHVQHDPSFLYQDPPVAISESLALSMDSQHDPPQMPPPVCIGHRDAPLFTSPPRQAYNDPSLLNQNPPGASSESLTPSMDSLHNPLQPTLHVCIGHRDAPRASSPPRHWDSPGVARHSSPQSGPSASKGSGNGEGRRNMEREEYTVLADLPPPKRLNQKEAMGKQNGSASDHTRSPGRTEVERIFGYERRKSEALETYQALEAGRSQRGSGRASGQLQRRQSSPALGREPESDGGTLPEPEHPEAAKDQDTCLMTDQEKAATADNIQAKGKAVSPPKGRLVTSWRMPGDQPTLFNPFLISLGVLKWRRPDLLNFKKGWMSILDEPGEWKKHWFVLTDSSLKYYRDSNAEEADELDGEIDLRSCTDVTEFAVQRNYGFQIHTKDAVFTLSAMTSGIRRNWIEALRKTVRPANAPDVTKLSDSNKENTIHGYSSQKGSLKSEEQRPASDVISRGTNRKADGQRQSFDYVELSPLTQGSPQRRVGSVRGSERGAKQDELERDLAQRSEERRKWFEATDSRAGELSAGEGPRKVLGGPLTEDQQSRLSDEIEKKWLELEKLPLRENKRVPLTALLMQSKGEQKGPSGDVTEALEKEVQSLRAQLESCRLRGEGSQDTPKPHDDGHIPRGYISQEACERSLAEMESSHQQVMEELQRHHQRELERLQQEKEWLLAEETAATASAIEAMKKAFKEELNKELGKTRSLQQGPESLRKQHQSDVDSLKRELQVLSEQYSQKCLEIGDLTRQAEEREHVLRHCQQEGRGLLRQNQELHSRLSEEIGRLRSFIASQASSEGLGHNNERSSCELEMLLRVKENELQYLKKEVQCLRNELQMIQKDKRFASGKYQDVYVELNHIKSRSEREIEQLKEHLRLAMAALREKESMRNNLDN